MTDTSLPDLGAKRKGGFLKKMMSALLTTAVLAGGGFAAGLYFAGTPESAADQVLRLLEQGEPDDETMPAQRMPRPAPDAPRFQTSYYAFEDALTTNLQGSQRFLQVGVGLSTQYDAAVITNVETHVMALRSDMLAVISSFSEEAISGEDGRKQLAADLMRAINARLEQLEGFGGVEDVFFSSFVLQ